jgi:hypothetical protein
VGSIGLATAKAKAKVQAEAGARNGIARHEPCNLHTEAASRRISRVGFCTDRIQTEISGEICAGACR